MTASSVAGATVRVPRRTAPAHQGAGGAPTPGWNPAGRSASHWDGSESASLKYHPFGRRTEATVKGQTTYDLYGASDGGHPIAENTGGAWHREAIMDGVRWGWLYQNGDGRYTLPDALGPAALWAQTFGLDPFGNLKSEGSVNWQPNYDGSNHASNTAYDADGNTLNDGFHAYAWDAAGEMATVDSSQAVYDALGRRVEGAGAEWLYAPSGGNRLALMGGQSLNFAVVPLPSGFAVYNSAGLALYQHADWLGSSRVDSTPARTATSLTAYAPYGDPDNGMSDLGFTGKGMNLVNGATAGLYDFPFREYQPTAGRWLSPDPAGLAAVSPANPQSWNRYAYVANQPLSAIDPLGLSPPADATVYLSYMNFDAWIQETQFDMGGGWGARAVPHSDAKPDHPYSPGTGSFSGLTATGAGTPTGQGVPPLAPPPGFDLSDPTQRALYTLALAGQEAALVASPAFIVEWYAAAAAVTESPEAAAFAKRVAAGNPELILNIGDFVTDLIPGAPLPLAPSYGHLAAALAQLWRAWGCPGYQSLCQ